MKRDLSLGEIGLCWIGDLLNSGMDVLWGTGIMSIIEAELYTTIFFWLNKIVVTYLTWSWTRVVGVKHGDIETRENIQPCWGNYEPES